MMLAEAWAEHPVELRADMQRYYGLNIDGLGRDYDAWHLAACVACLPLGSTLMASMDERGAWTMTDLMLYLLMQRACGQQPSMPWEADASDTGVLPDIEPMYLDEFEAWHSQEWKEVGECQEVR